MVACLLYCISTNAMTVPLFVTQEDISGTSVMEHTLWHVSSALMMNGSDLS